MSDAEEKLTLLTERERERVESAREVINTPGHECDCDLKGLLATITSLQAENAALVEAVKGNCIEPFGDRLACVFCGETYAPTPTFGWKDLTHKPTCIVSNPTSAGSALLKRLEDAEATLTEARKTILEANADIVAIRKRAEAAEALLAIRSQENK
jgi:hypothetical protein